jgi:hypothetical protein
MTDQLNPPCTPLGEYQEETLDSFSEQLQQDLHAIWNKRYHSIFTIIQQIIAHPHTTLTEHDMHRAVVIISFISGDDELNEYVHSLLTQHDVEKIKQIRSFVYSNTND